MNPTTQNELIQFIYISIIQYVTLIACTYMYVTNLLKYVFLFVNLATDLFLCVFIWAHCLTLGNNKSLKETVKGHSTESPLIGFSTPKRPPIMDVVQV